MENKKIGVIFQGFYGNRTYMNISESEIDSLLQGCLSSSIRLRFETDRSIVPLPDSQCILVYNRHQEARTLMDNRKWLELEGYAAKPLAFVPEKQLEIFNYLAN